MNENATTLISLGVLVLAILLGLGLMGYGIRNSIDARKSKNWPTVEGKITRSVMTEKLEDDSRTSYTLHVGYEYTIDRSRFTGKQFKGHRIWFSSHSFYDPDEAMRQLEQYPIGKKVTVFYHPEDPGKSVLVPGKWLQNTPLIAVGLFFLSLGSLFLWLLLSGSTDQ